MISVGEVPNFSKNKPPWLTYILNSTREEIAKAMSQIDIWIVASHTEGLGRMTLEAMSSSCAIVATNTNAEFLVDGENCLLAEPGDINGLVKAVDTLYNNKQLKDNLIANGYETACKYSDSRDYVKSWQNIIGDLF